MKTWQQTADEHSAHLTDEQEQNAAVQNLVRLAADIEQAEQAGNQVWADRLTGLYDRTVARMGHDPLA